MVKSTIWYNPSDNRVVHHVGIYQIQLSQFQLDCVDDSDVNYS